MVFEKKMLILSGDGKGVVLAEKNAHGCTFSLRTFDLPPCGALKAGVITPNAVYVRDLPLTDNPAAAFTLDVSSLDDVHFAVFDKKLRLYGATAKRMWESNVMDLLTRHENRPPVNDGINRAPLPPIAPPPKVLPMPDGTGIAQTRLALYGDEAIAETDFYTPIAKELSARMPAVDSFLSEPRVTAAAIAHTPTSRPAVLDERIAPRVAPPATTEPATGSDRAQSEIRTVAVEFPAEAEEPEQVEKPSESEAQKTQSYDEPIAEVAAYSEAQTLAEPETEPEPEADAQAKAEAEAIQTQTSAMNDDDNGEPTENMPERRENGAHTEPTASEKDPPWMLAARWIKRRSSREAVLPAKRVLPQEAPAQKIKTLRESSFFERARGDIKKLFEYGEKDEKLSALLPDLAWVKVHAGNDVVSVGKSAEAFLCYAVDGEYQKTSPIGEEAQWLPCDKNMPTGKGYWLVFQNLATGEIISG